MNPPGRAVGFITYPMTKPLLHRPGNNTLAQANAVLPAPSRELRTECGLQRPRLQIPILFLGPVPQTTIIK